MQHRQNLKALSFAMISKIRYEYQQIFSSFMDQLMKSIFYAMQQSAPIVHRNLKPKLSLDDNESKLMTPSKLKGTSTPKPSLAQSIAELKPPCIDDIRKLKPTTPIKVSSH